MKNQIFLAMVEVLHGGGSLTFDIAEELARLILKSKRNRIVSTNFNNFVIQYRKYYYGLTAKQASDLSILVRASRIKKYW